MNYSIILNQHAGNGNANKAWAAIKPFLDAQGISYHLETTKYYNHAEYLGTKLGSDDHHEPIIVLVIGGDGTLHQVINGIMKGAKKAHRTPLPVGYIPAGTGNDFARGFGISMKPLKALQQVLTASEAKEIHIGHYQEAIHDEEGYFLNNIGIGFDAAIVSRANSYKATKKRNHMGHLTYLFKALGVIYDQEPFSLMVNSNQTRSIFGKAYIVIVSNHPFIGGGFKIAPHASLHQPTLDLVVAERKNWLMTFWQLLQFARGKLDSSRYAHLFKGQQLKISTTSLEFCQTDGEEMGNRFVDFSFDTTTFPIWQVPETK